MSIFIKSKEGLKFECLKVEEISDEELITIINLLYENKRISRWKRTRWINGINKNNLPKWKLEEKLYKLATNKLYTRLLRYPETRILKDIKNSNYQIMIYPKELGMGAAKTLKIN